MRSTLPGSENGLNSLAPYNFTRARTYTVKWVHLSLRQVGSTHFCMWVEPTCKVSRTKENTAECGRLWSDGETRMLLGCPERGEDSGAAARCSSKRSTIPRDRRAAAEGRIRTHVQAVSL